MQRNAPKATDQRVAPKPEAPAQRLAETEAGQRAISANAHAYKQHTTRSHQFRLSAEQRARRITSIVAEMAALQEEQQREERARAEDMQVSRAEAENAEAFAAMLRGVNAELPDVEWPMPSEQGDPRQHAAMFGIPDPTRPLPQVETPDNPQAGFCNQCGKPLWRDERVQGGLVHGFGSSACFPEREDTAVASLGEEPRS